MEPFSYQGFGFTAILLMIAVISAGQLFKYLKERNVIGQKTSDSINQNSLVESVKKPG